MSFAATLPIMLPARIPPITSIRQFIGSPLRPGNKCANLTLTNGFRVVWNRLQVQWKESGDERFRSHDVGAKSITDMKEQVRDAKKVSGQ